MRNLESVTSKHPELALVARRWTVDTFDKLANEARGGKEDDVAEPTVLEPWLSSTLRQQQDSYHAYRPKPRPLRILSYCSHAAYLRELFKLPHLFTLADDLDGTGALDSSEFGPPQANLRFVPADAIDPSDYDLAILHFDEQLLGTLPPGARNAFWWLLEAGCPAKIAVCHGTQTDADRRRSRCNLQVEAGLCDAARRYIVDRLAAQRVDIVCDSWGARLDWSFGDAKVIRQGLEPQDCPNGQHDLGVLTSGQRALVCAGGQQNALNRLLADIDVGFVRHEGAAMETRQGQAYATKSLRSSNRRIGRFSFFLSTDRRSPGPFLDSVMMAGVIPVSLRNPDVERLVTSGVNGFCSDEPEALAEWINKIHLNPDQKSELSRGARRTALDLCNHDRFLRDWQSLIENAASSDRL